MNNHRAWRLLFSITVLASSVGCASRHEPAGDIQGNLPRSVQRDIQALAHNESERVALQEFASDYPDMADHKYPRATPKS